MSTIRYILFEKRAGGAVETYLASTPEGRRAMVHFLRGPDEELRRLLSDLDGLTGDQRRRIQRRDEVDGVPVLVTEVLEPFTDLPSWVASAASAPPASSAAPGVAADEPGEFTRLFVLGEGRTEGAGAEAEPDPPTEGPEDPAPGEFTRLFLQGDVPGREGSGPEEEVSRPPKPSDPGPAPSPESAEPDGGGDGARADREPPRGPPDAAGDAEGPPSPRPASTATGEPASPAEAPGEEGPGEFTRLFGGGAREREPPREPLGSVPLDGPEPGGSIPEDPDGYLNRLGGRSSDPEPPETEGMPPPPAPSEPDPPTPRGPSRYTQVVQGGAAAPGGSGPSPAGGAPSGPREPPAPEGPAKGRKESSGGPTWPYLAALGALVVIAVAVVLFLALRGEETPEVPAGERPAAGEVIEPGAETPGGADGETDAAEGGGSSGRGQ